MSTLAFALSYSGFTALCFALERTHRALGRPPPSARLAIALRTAGFALLALALAPSMAGLEGSTGIVAWFGFLTAAGLLLVFLLPYAPRLAQRLAVVAPLAAALEPLVRG